MTIDFIVPLYNEEERLQRFFPQLIRELKKYIPRKDKFRVILVNDGSTDQTLKMMKACKIKYRNVEFVSYTINRGKGYAIKKGVEKASGDLIFFSDIDLSVDLSILRRSVSKLKHDDTEIVIASRRLSKSILLKRQPFLREKFGMLYVFFSKTYLGLDESDLTCGLKGFKKEAAKKIFSYLKNERWAFDSELLFLANKFKYRVIELPAKWTNNEKSKVSIAIDSLRSLWETIRIRIYYLQGKYNA